MTDRRELPPTPVATLDALIDMAQRFGRDPEFSRGGGGNASAKVDGVLYIKPSGVALATLEARDLVPLDMGPLLALLEVVDAEVDDLGSGDAPIGEAEVDDLGSGDAPIGGAPSGAKSDARGAGADQPGVGGDPSGVGGDPSGVGRDPSGVGRDPSGVGRDPVMRTAMAARLATAGGRRPSVELLFHAFLPERFVLHTHPLDINAVTCHRDGAGLARRLFGDRVLWVPYADPGLPLARTIVDARRAYAERTGAPAPAVTLMQNHGMIIGGETAAEIEARSAWIVETVRAAIDTAAAPSAAPPSTLPSAPTGADGGPGSIHPARARTLVDAIAPTLRGLLASGDALRVVTFDDSPLAAAFTATPAGRGVVLGGPMTPDQIVYAGSWPLLLDIPDDLGANDVPRFMRECLAEHVAAHETLPLVVVVPGVGEAQAARLADLSPGAGGRCAERGAGAAGHREKIVLTMGE